MSLTSPYRQHNYMGEFASDALCEAGISTRGWTLENGVWYYNTSSHVHRYRVDGAWTGSTETPFAAVGDIVQEGSDYKQSVVDVDLKMLLARLLWVGEKVLIHLESITGESVTDEDIGGERHDY